MAKICELIEQKAVGSNAQQLLWGDAIARLKALELENKSIEQVLIAASHPQDLLHLAQMLKTELSVSGIDVTLIWSEFLKHVNDSDRELAEWLNALAEIGAWLMGNNLKTNLRRAVGYVDCSLEAAEVGLRNGVNLPIVVHEMLHQYGFDD